MGAPIEKEYCQNSLIFLSEGVSWLNIIRESNIYRLDLHMLSCSQDRETKLISGMSTGKQRLITTFLRGDWRKFETLFALLTSLKKLELTFWVWQALLAKSKNKFPSVVPIFKRCLLEPLPGSYINVSSSSSLHRLVCCEEKAALNTKIMDVTSGGDINLLVSRLSSLQGGYIFGVQVWNNSRSCRCL